MTITYTTTINSLYTIQSPQPNYVVNALWTVTGTDGTNTASIQGNTQLTVQESDPNFVPYANLTAATVIGWIPADQIASAQANVAGQIASIITPPVSPANTPLPWATA
jgi:type II secretory pathway component PulK